MVKFEKQLRAAKRAEWADRYLDYRSLKKLVKRIQGGGKAASSDEFIAALDREVEKVSLFFLQQQGLIAERILAEGARRGAAAAAASGAGSALRPAHGQDANARLAGTCFELHSLLRYLELNATAVRKILKKHDKMIAERNVAGEFLLTRRDAPDSHLRNLILHEGLGAILSSLEALLPAEDLGDWRAVVVDLQRQRRQLSDAVHFELFLSSRALLFSAFDLEDAQDLVGAPEAAALLREEPRAGFTPSVWLNLLGFFFFNTNYYVAVPTMTKYAKALRLSPEFSGLIIGCAAVAQLLSNVGYSRWSNSSFRLPLQLSTLLLLAGNLATALALDADSILLLCLGRFLVGAGGCESVNRRHIADTVPFEHRTRVSAAFVAAGALGMAAGPLLAALLYPLDLRAPAGGGLSVNKLTAPGYFMALLWVLYLAALSRWWQEPDLRTRFLPLEADEEAGSSGSESGSGAAPGRPPTERTRLLPPHLLRSQSGDSDGGGAEERRAEGGLRETALTLLRHTPLLYTLLVYFEVELVDEVLLSSAGLVTDAYFGWRIHDVGVFLAMLGVTVLPANFLVGRMSAAFEDRTLLAASLVSAALGMLCVLSYGLGPEAVPRYSAFQFCTGAVLTFTSVAVMEGVGTSLMSKLIPPSLARGSFNSGLLATQVGTLGRVLADLLITLAGVLAAKAGGEGASASLVDWLYAPLVVVNALVLGLGVSMYGRLRV